MSESPIHVVLLRLLARQPDGTRIGETRRVCHVVPVPYDLAEIPESLTAYCGLEIRPNTAEFLGRITGMPCQPCVAKVRLGPDISKILSLRAGTELGDV